MVNLLNLTENQWCVLSMGYQCPTRGVEAYSAARERNMVVTGADKMLVIMSDFISIACAVSPDKM